MSHDPEDVFAHFYIDGAWRETYAGVELSPRVRGQDSIRVTRGGSDQFASITSQVATFTLNNGDNFFTDDDPMSPLFRLFGQNTRCRFGIAHPTRGLDLHARMSETPAEGYVDRIYTVDKASLDITGDIDIRWEMDPRITRDMGHIIASKYLTSGDQRSWLLYSQPDGRFSFRHASLGTTASSILHTSTTRLLADHEGRRAYRLTLDVNDGAGNRVYRWYTADSIDGSWTLAETNTLAGATSIYAGNTELIIGAGNGGFQTLTGPYRKFAGKFYRFELRNGINGTLVADFDPAQDAELEGTTWVDTCASPNTWIIYEFALDAIRLGSDRVRFTGEIQTRPDDWDLTGKDRWCPMTAQGTLARYSSTRAEIKSAMRRYWTRQTGVVGYWPAEDEGRATQVSSALDGGIPATINDVSFGATDGFDGSAGALSLGEQSVTSASFLASPHADTGAWGFVFYIKLDELPVSTAVLANIYPRNGTVKRWAFGIGGTSFDFTGYSASGSVVASVGVIAGVNVSTEWVAIAMTMKQEGGNVRWETSWHAVGSSLFYSHLGGGSTYAGTVGTVKEILFNPTEPSFEGAQISQIVMFNRAYGIGSNEFASTSKGFSGETFGARWKRLLGEEGIACEWTGALEDTEVVGPQPVDTLYSILEEGAKLDGGLIYEARDAISWCYVTGKMLGNRKRLELSYTGSHLAATPRPTGDGRFTVNDFTASRRGGGSARYEATDNRRKNVREPDDANPGVGRVERADSYNVFADDRLPYIASQRVFLGTWDERIIPSLAVDPHRRQIADTPALLADVFGQDIGDQVSIVDTAGTPLPPNEIDTVVTGYSETFSNMLHELVFNTIPAGPYQVPVIESYDEDFVPVLDVADDETTLDGTLNTTATAINFKTLRTAKVPRWVDSTNYPDDIGGGVTLDVDIAGERVTFTSITAPTSDATYNYQTATATRSVNGVVKSHGSGTPLKIFSPSYLGRI